VPPPPRESTRVFSSWGHVVAERLRTLSTEYSVYTAIDSGDGSLPLNSKLKSGSYSSFQRTTRTYYMHHRTKSSTEYGVHSCLNYEALPLYGAIGTLPYVIHSLPLSASPIWALGAGQAGRSPSKTSCQRKLIIPNEDTE
jgi:hypothetical protein